MEPQISARDDIRPAGWMPQAPSNFASGEDNHARHGRIVVEVPGTLVLQGGGIVYFNFESGAVDIQLFAIGADAETEARAAWSLVRLGQVIVGQVECPKLAALVAMRSVRDDRVCRLLIRRDVQSRHAGWRWTDR